MLLITRLRRPSAPANTRNVNWPGGTSSRAALSSAVAVRDNTATHKHAAAQARSGVTFSEPTGGAETVATMLAHCGGAGLRQGQQRLRGRDHLLGHQVERRLAERV